MTDPSKSTLDVYDEKASSYADLVGDTEDPAFDAFVAEIPAGGYVLDLGCGPGHTAALLALAGFRVLATDGSAEMVKLAGEHEGVEARQAMFDDITGDNIFDGIWASFSLLHAPKTDFPGHLSALHKAAKPGARLHLGMKLGTGEGPDSIGRFYAYYTQDELYDLLREAGFTPLSHLTGEAVSLSGSNDPRITIAAHA